MIPQGTLEGLREEEEGASDWESETPDGHIESILERDDRMLGRGADRQDLAIATDSLEHSDDVAIGDAPLQAPLVVAADQVVVLPHPEDAMHDVLPIVALVERDVPKLETSCRSGRDNEQIATLTQEGHHAGADVGIHQLALTCEYFFKCG